MDSDRAALWDASVDPGVPPASVDLVCLARDLDPLSAARRWLSDAEISEVARLELRARACLRAAEACGVDRWALGEQALLPGWLVGPLYAARQGAANLAVQRLIQSDPGSLERHDGLLPAALALYRASREGFMHTELGLVRPRFDPLGGRTERFRTLPGSFRCMSIPRGPERLKIVSKWPGGRIASLDFNAIDYRSIVAHVPELAALYAGAGDFHARTAELAGLRSRDEAKGATYPALYGGPAHAGVVALFAPAAALRERAHTELAEAHPGASLAIWAQRESARAFARGLGALGGALRGRRTHVIFTVHDEAILDVAPETPDSTIALLGELLAAGASSIGQTDHSVKARWGSSYGDLVYGSTA